MQLSEQFPARKNTDSSDVITSDLAWERSREKTGKTGVVNEISCVR